MKVVFVNEVATKKAVRSVIITWYVGHLDGVSFFEYLIIRFFVKNCNMVTNHRTVTRRNAKLIALEPSSYSQKSFHCWYQIQTERFTQVVDLKLRTLSIFDRNGRFLLKLNSSNNLQSECPNLSLPHYNLIRRRVRIMLEPPWGKWILCVNPNCSVYWPPVNNAL